MSASSSIRAMRFIPVASRRAAGAGVFPRGVNVFMDAPRLTEAAGDVVLSDLLPGIGEDLVGAVALDEPAEHEESGVLRNARRLLHVVRHDDDRVVALELVDKFLDLL